MRHAIQILSIAAIVALPAGCGRGSASAGVGVSSNGTVSASASVSTPGGGATLTADTGTVGVVVPQDQGGYVATTVPTGCIEEWVHMPLVINFPTGGANLDAQNRMVLQEMVVSAQTRDDISAVRVEGHTDTCGNEANNMALSQQRAVTIANELVSMGVPGERISTVGYGSTQPRANEECARDQTESLSRNMNRRVEFSLLICRND